MAQIIPGILTNDEVEYGRKLRTAEHASDLIQIDLIDGKFANNMTVGTYIIRKYASNSNLEVQLMVEDTYHFIEELADLDYVGRIIVPYEAKSDLTEAIYRIKKSGKQVGVSINPPTAVRESFVFLDEIDLLLILAGNPGFSGQPFDEKTIDRIKEARAYDPKIAIEVDIGVNFETAEKIAKAGANFLVASSALWNAEDFYIAYEKLAKLASKD